MDFIPERVLAAPVLALDDVTVCEVSCRLVGLHGATATGCAAGLSCPAVKIDLAAIDDALLKHVPVIDVTSNTDKDSPGHSHCKQQPANGSSSSNTWSHVFKCAGQQLLARLNLPPLLGGSVRAQTPCLVAWQHRQQVLAVGHSSSGAVLLYDLRSGGQGCMEQAQQILTHQLQQQVSSLAWRPENCSNLAVGCEGGVALWSLGKLPVAASSIHKGDAGAAAGWVTFLPFKHKCRVTALSWSPDGRLLAGSSADCNRLMVWDVALGVGSALRLGLEPVTTLSWSPDGNYLFAAAQSSRFFRYDTANWSVRAWHTHSGAAVTAAAWAPDSSMVLMALSSSNYLVAMHFVGNGQHQAEQLLPVLLPGVSDALDKEAQNTSCIESLVWDATGNRLAVVLTQPHPAAGTVALYSTTYQPVVTCTLIGFVQPGAAVDSADAPQDQENDCQAATDAVNSRPLQVAFAFAAGKAGALLSLGKCSTSGRGALAAVLNVPMYF